MVQANIAYREGGRFLPVPLKELKVPFRGKEIKGYLHLPHDDSFCSIGDGDRSH